MSLYSLTHLTGRKRNADRKIIIATVETSKHGFIVSVVAVIASLLPTTIAVSLFGPAAMVIVPPLFIIAALILFRYRSQKGLQLPMYKTLLDRNAAKRVRGQILVCGVPMQSSAVLGTAVRSSHPITAADLYLARAKDVPDAQRVTQAPAFGSPSKPAVQHTNEPSDLWD